MGYPFPDYTIHNIVKGLMSFEHAKLSNILLDCLVCSKHIRRSNVFDTTNGLIPFKLYNSDGIFHI